MSRVEYSEFGLVGLEMPGWVYRSTSLAVDCITDEAERWHQKGLVQEGNNEA